MTIGERLDLDSYLSWMRVTDDGRILHLGCVLTPAGARLAADRLRELADQAECICGEINARHCPVHSEDKS